MRKVIYLKDIEKFAAKDLYAVLYKDVIYFGIYFEKDNIEMAYLPSQYSEIFAKDLTKFSSYKDGEVPKRIYECDDVYIDDILIEMEKDSLLIRKQIEAIEKDVNYQRYVYQLNKINTAKNLIEQRKKISAVRNAYEFKMEKQ